jgi:hypothetical protein
VSWAAALALAAQAAAALLSPAQFRDRMAAAARAETHQPTTTVDDRTFRTKRGDGTDLTINIDNAYQQYRAAPDLADAVIARYVRLLVAAPPAAAVEQLVVIVRPSTYVAAGTGLGADPASLPRPRPLAGDLSLFLAIDSPETIRLANKADLAGWHLAEAQAWPLAIAHIRARMGRVAIARLGGEAGAPGLTADSGLAPSVLADPELCGAGASRFGGWSVLLYSRDMLLIADPADRAMVELFERTARDEIAADRSMSSTVLTCRGGHWVAR